jgi:hypothetical protein
MISLASTLLSTFTLASRLADPFENCELSILPEHT